MNFYTHDLSPIAFSLFGLPFPWYWLVYFCGYFFIINRYNFLFKNNYTNVDPRDFYDFMFWGFFSMLLGGKISYILFYNFNYYSADWSRVFKIYEGGMSFHGALVASSVFCAWFSRKRNLDFWRLGDIVSLNIGLVLFFGRLANFVNGELAGRVTNVAWAVIFPRYRDLAPRHPSQIYEAFLEGLLIYWILNRSKNDLINSPGRASIRFLAFYGIARFFCEFFRQADIQIGLISIFTIGQIYCILMILVSFILFIKKSNENMKTKLSS